MRAFLSHSSVDKPFVALVAKELGRQLCVFDQYEFATGEDFRQAIRKGLDSSDVFVLFASKTSKERKWVEFELDEAELRKIRGAIKKLIVFMIDDDTSISDIPEWLQRGKVKKQKSPKLCARKIDYHLHELVRDRQQPVFVGRTTEITEAEKALIPIDGSKAPRFFLLFGLPGIGRRTLARRIANDVLRLPKSIVIPIETGDGLTELAIKVSEEVAPFGSQQEFKDKIERLEKEGRTLLMAQLVDDLRAFVDNGDMPILHDQGGLLNDDGNILEEFTALLGEIEAVGDVYLAIVTTRRPAVANERPAAIMLPTLRVTELKMEEIKRLLSSIANYRQITVDTAQISGLADYVRGYPPAAFYALELVRRYGIESALSNQRPLVDFRTSFFLSAMAQREFNSSERKRVLSILAFYGSLPQGVIGRALNLSPERMAECLEYLFDCAFVIPRENGYCSLAEPLVDAVLRTFGGISSIDHGKLAVALENYLAELDDDEKRLALSRALFRALTLSGRGQSSRSTALTSDFVRLTEDFYHDQDYENAIKFGRLAVERRPENIELRSYYIRALVKNEDYVAAEAQIQEIRRLGAVRDSYYLTGFLERRRERITAAIEAYEEAVRRGRGGVSIHRELADCYFHIGKLPEARKNIDKAQARDPDNRYIVDLQIQIATSQRDEETARSRLKILEAVDDTPYFLHRLSTVEYAFGETEAAYLAAFGAFGRAARPTLAMMSQLIKCEIETQRNNEASEHLNLLERRFARVKHDIKIGLRCKWEISNSKFENALALWNQLHDKSKPVHKALLRDALTGLIANIRPNDPRRASFQSQIRELDATLSIAKPGELDFPIDDDR